jgi:tRNA A-37 threonylcarbamoyl transferase component Bud32
VRAAREVRAAAALCSVGFDGMRLLTTADPVEAMVMQAVAEHTAKYLQQRDKALAIEIANAVGKLFK